MSPGDHGVMGSQGSADPPIHVEEGDLDTDDETELRLAQRNGQSPPASDVHPEARIGSDAQRREAREPAPTEANPLSEPEARPLDSRTSSLE